MMTLTYNWPFRRTPDNVIEPLLRIPDEEILALWKPMVPYEHRPGRRKEWLGPTVWTQEKRLDSSDRALRRRRARQEEYAEVCVPQEDGDDTILRMFSSGVKVADIATQVGLKFGEVRLRIIACHPDGKTLR